jgi:nitric oxide reductase subunit B
MANGSIWGHGAYLGPDFSASALHRMGLVTAEAIAKERNHQTFGTLTRSQAAAVQAETTVSLKTNRYDESTRILRFTAAQATSFDQEIAHWAGYFHDPSRNGGLKADLHHRPGRTAPVHGFCDLGGP